MNSEMAGLGRTLTLGVTLPILAIGAASVSAAAQMDSLTRGLTAVAGSGVKAQEQLKRLEDVAKLPGLGFREAIQGSIRLQAAGLSVALAERALRSFGNAIALTGGGKQQLDSVTVQLGQLAAKGKVLGSDLRPIIEAAPAVGEALRKAFGTVDPEQIQKLHLSTERFLTLLMNQLDQLPHVTGGAANSFENLEDAIFKARVAIGEKLLPVIVPLIEGLATMLENVRALDPNVVKWGISIAAVAAVAGPLILIVSTLTTAVAALAGALAIGLLPAIVVGGPILLGLGALAVLFVRNKLEALSAASAIDTFRASLAAMDRAALESGIQSRVGALVNLERARTSLLGQLNQARADAARLQAQAPGPLGDIGGIPGSRRDALGRLRPGFEETPSGFKASDLQEAQGRVARLTGLLTNLGNESSRVRDEFRLMGAQLNTSLNQPAQATPLGPPQGGGADKMRGLVDQLSDSLRELEQLQKFKGVASISLLPPDAREQIGLLNSLTGELDKLEDGLNRLRSAGRTAPEGLTTGIRLLWEQVQQAGRELDRMAFRFNFGGPPQTTRIDPGPLPVQDRLSLSGPARKAGEALDTLTERVKQAGIAFKHAMVSLSEAIEQGALQAAAGSSQFANNAISMGSKLMQAGKGLAAAGPAALAFAAAMEVVTGAFSVIGPAIDALTLPLRFMGEIIGLLIVPVLRILWQPLKLLGIVVSYIGEVIAKVAGAIAVAIGSLVRGIGRLVNKLPGSPGDPLVKAGQAMIDLGNQFKDAAKEMAKRRKELEGLSFEDAMDKTSGAAERLAESMLNAVQGFKIERFRFGALESTSSAIPASSVRAEQAPAQAPVTINGMSIPVNIVAHDADGREIYRNLYRELSAQSLKHTKFRPIFYLFPQPA